MRPGDLILANPLTQTPKDFFGKCFATATALGRGWDGISTLICSFIQWPDTCNCFLGLMPERK